MNAFTSADHTSYPFATTNQKDFKNLMSVYLDATLHPLLKEDDFSQEGWRIGPENPKQSEKTSNQVDSQLVFKGVVYNEMKGQMSDASYLYYTKYQDHIFPDINNSGGDPQRMTDLTYEQLKGFHATHYHPSNAKIFTYGDMSLEDHLVDVGRQLNQFDRIRSDQVIKRPIVLDGPRDATVPGPVDPLMDASMQYKTSTSWIMGDTSDVLETFSLGVMSSLLLDGYGSPLYRGLIEAGLGPDWSPNTGFDSAGKIGIFCIGLNGVKAENVEAVKTKTATVLHEVHQKGFDKGKVDGLLHQLELALKHKTANFGMNLMQRLQPGWFNGIDPFDALAWEETVSEFKKRFAQEGYLEGLLEKYLLNENTFTFTMEPSATYGDELAKEEAERLAGKIAELSAAVGGDVEAYKKLTERELQLMDVQEKARKQDLSCLPMVRVADIPRQMERKPTRDSQIDGVRIQWREAPTNGLTYFRAINVLEGLPTELRMLMPLFTDCLLRLGTKDKTMEQLEDLIKLKTGGVRVSYHASTSPYDTQKCEEGVSLSGYALDSNVDTMYDLLRTLLLETNFEGSESKSMIRQLLQTDASNALNAIANSGHSYARRYAEAGLTPCGLLTEQVSGLTQIRYTASLASRSEDHSLQDVIAKLKIIQQLAVSSSSSFRTALTCDPASTSANEASLQRFLATLPSKSANSSLTSSSTSPTNVSHSTKSFFPLPYQVYYSGVVLPTVPYTSASCAPLTILASLLTHKHLHHEIRESGGAYGGGAFAPALRGVFGFYSYRDPNPTNTLAVIRDVGRWARERRWTDLEIEEAKLSVFQGIDAPESVNQEGMARFVTGIDEEMEQRRREALLDVGQKEIADVTEKFLGDIEQRASVAVLGEKKDWVDDSWKIVEAGISADPGAAA